MSQAKLIIGDVMEVLRSLPDDSVDLCLTSSPFLALRSYLPSDHPLKAKELGSEPTPGAFIDAMLDVVEEVRRVLAPHGSMAWELGDTYAGSGGAGGDYGENGLREGQPKFRQDTHPRDYRPGREGTQHALYGRPANGGGRGWPLDKSLALVPESFRWALAYGRNPFTGRETEPWRIRNVVRHFRPNPPVGSLGDKWRGATLDWVVACTSRTRYFDLDAVREPHQNPEHRERYPQHLYANTGKAPLDRATGRVDGGKVTGTPLNPAGAPPLDWCIEDDLEWKDGAGIVEPTSPYPGSHYATFSPKLIRRFIECMTPSRVCRVCGEPSRRVVTEDSPRVVDDGNAGKDRTQGRHTGGAFVKRHTVTDAVRSTLGWTDCGHDDWRPGVVLDPFSGSGTTLAVATGHGRDAIGIDLDERNADLALERVGMFLTVEHFKSTEGAA